MATISAKDFLKKGPVQVIGSDHQMIEQAAPSGDGFFKRVWNTFESGGKAAINEAQSAASDIGSVQNLFTAKGVKRLAETGLRQAGNVAGTATKLIGDIPGVNQAVGGVIKGVDKVTPGNLTQDISNVAGAYESWKAQHPDAAKNLEASVNIASLLPIGAAENQLANTAAGGATKTLEVGSKVATSVGGKLKNAGEAAFGVSVGMTDPTKIALQAYEAAQPSLMGRVKNLLTGVESKVKGIKPITEANTAARLLEPGTEWQLGVHAKRVSDQLWSGVLEPALKATGADRVNMPAFLKEVRKDIMKVADLNRRSTLLDAYGKFADDFGKVGDVSWKKFQDYKSGWAKRVPEATYKGKPVAGALNEIRDTAAGKARTMLYDKLGPEAKQAYFDYGNLQSIEKAGIKSVDLLRSKGMTKQIYEFILDKAVTPVTTVLGKVLYKTGEGLEFIGEKGAQKVRDIIGSAPQATPSIIDRSPIAQAIKNNPPNVGLTTTNVAKQIDNLTKDEMIKAIDYIRLKQPYDQQIEQSIGALAQKFGIADRSPSSVVAKFQKLVETTKTKDVSGRVPTYSKKKVR